MASTISALLVLPSPSLEVVDDYSFSSIGSVQDFVLHLIVKAITVI